MNIRQATISLFLLLAPMVCIFNAKATPPESPVKGPAEPTAMTYETGNPPLKYAPHDGSEFDAKFFLSREGLEGTVTEVTNLVALPDNCGCAPAIKLEWSEFNEIENFLMGEHFIKQLGDTLVQLCATDKKAVCQGVLRVEVTCGRSLQRSAASGVLTFTLAPTNTFGGESLAEWIKESCNLGSSNTETKIARPTKDKKESKKAGVRDR